MNFEEIRGNPKVTECVSQMQEHWKKIEEARKLKAEAEAIKNRVGQAFSEIKAENLKILEEEEKSLEMSLDALEHDKKVLEKQFCEQRGKHELKSVSWYTSSTPLYHSFGRGDVYPTESCSKCIICGYQYGVYSPIHPISYTIKERERVIDAVANFEENHELQETAKKLLNFPSKKEKVWKKSENLRTQFCEIFGHSPVEAGYNPNRDENYYRCTVCGRFLDYKGQGGSKLFDIIWNGKE